MNDIEKLLEEYGTDRQQQQRAAGQLRYLARKAARVRASIVCALLALSTVVGIYLWRPQENSEIIVAEKNDQNENHNENEKTNIDIKTIQVEPVSETEKTLFAEQQKIETVITTDNDNNDTVTKAIETEQSVVDYEKPISELFAEAQPILQYTDPDHPSAPMQTDNERRFRLTASIGASAMSDIGTNAAPETEHLIGLSGDSYITINPSATFSAKIGVTYALANIGHSRFDIGLAVNGQSQQGTIVKYNVSYLHGIEGNTTVIDETEQHFNTLSLYASMPLIINFSPHGSEKTAWMLSLTPAHSIVSSRKLGYAQSNPFAPNPWKMTFGVGLKFPRRVIGSISLTANLFPTYTSNSIHEIGLEIGF